LYFITKESISLVLRGGVQISIGIYQLGKFDFVVFKIKTSEKSQIGLAWD